MKQPIKKNKFSYFARSHLRLRPQEIWERDYTGHVRESTRIYVVKVTPFQDLRIMTDGRDAFFFSHLGTRYK